VRHELEELERNAHGSGMVHVTKGIFDDTPVAVPESAELQERIAKIIDRADNLQASASLHLSSACAALGRFRLSSLAAAFRESTDECLSDEDLVPLERLLREPLRNGYSAQPVNVETPYRVLMLTATTSGQFDGRFFKYTDKAFPKDSPFWLMPGDVVIQRGNTSEYVGVPALYEGPPGEFIYPDLMIRARPRDDIDPRYLWYMLLAPQSRNFLRERATGSAGNMPKINQKVLNGVPIPLPPEEVRKSIVMKLDVALSTATAAHERLLLGAGKLDQTSQAVLGRAFSGGLTT
jgi:type I restriction enzyme S subunit